MPKVSIIIPCYNVEEYLRECLDSVAAQTLKDIEIICVNDGSTDNSLAIINEYVHKDSRFVVIDKPNSGYGNTMNRGLDAATGEYIGIVESDDFVPHDMYEKLFNVATAHQLDFIKADFYRFARENGKLKLEYNELSYGNKHLCNKVINPAEHPEIFKFIMNTWSGIYKKTFLDQYHIRHNETPGASYQDNGFFFQTFCQAKRVWFLNKPFYMNRRDNPNSSVKNKEKVFCIRDEYDFIRKFLESKPELLKTFVHVYAMKKLHSYNFTVDRVADEFKPMFLEHYSAEFGKMMAAGELDQALFTEIEWNNLNMIIADPVEYYEEYKRRKKKSFKELYKETQRELNDVRTSNSYRIGRVVTWLPRMAKRLVKSLQQSGLRTTFAKAMSKFGKRVS